MGFQFGQGSNPMERMALAVDTSSIEVANSLMSDFAAAGGMLAKLGLEIASAPGVGGPEGLSRLAAKHDLSWVYDGKIKDIGNTMSGVISNTVKYDNPPIAITIHADTSFEGMQIAQEAAGDIPILGVTLLTDIGPEEAFDDYANEEEKTYVTEIGMTKAEAGALVRIRVVMERARKFGRAGVKGLVSSPKELAALSEDEATRPKLKMIPGTRSLHAQAHDQQNVMPPEEAIVDRADVLVIGRQYTRAEDKPRELEIISEEIARGLARRAA